MPDSWDFANNKPERPSLPIMTYGLALVCVAVTAANWASGMDRNSQWFTLGHLGWLPTELIWNGNYAPLLTSIFLHRSVLHIVFNMIVFLRLGSVIEDTINPLHYALFIVSAAIVSSGVEIAAFGEAGAGMSGVVYAMCGLMWAGRSKIAAWQKGLIRAVAGGRG